MKDYFRMEKGKIINSVLFAQDMVKYVKKYMEIMDAYYKNKENQKKDKFIYDEYIYFKKECEKGARKRGLL